MDAKPLIIALLFLFPSFLLSQVAEPVASDPRGELIEQENTIAGSESNEEDPNAFILLDEEPKPINLDEVRSAISYPKAWQDISGKVVVRVLIDKAGNYVKHIVLKNPHDELTQEVTKHLHKLKFTPGKFANEPLSVWLTIPFNICYRMPAVEKSQQD